MRARPQQHIVLSTSVTHVRRSTFALALLLTACASAPPPSAARRSAATTAADEARETLLKEGRSQGYKAQQRNGKTVYFRSEVQLGSRFDKTVCLSEEGLLAAPRRSKENQDLLMRAPVCAGTGCSGN